MSGRNHRKIPAPLARGRDRFRAWRRTRKAGDRIPDRLWGVAVKLAGAHGLSRTASVLKLDYYTLKRRIESMDPAEGPATSPAFLEFSPRALATSGECIIEFENDAGASMRVHLKGYDAPDLVALGRSFWNGQ